MYPLHRSKVLSEIRARLKNDEPCIVISTSLIEAGVDVDFPVVYREKAGLDSIIQSGGRCNREDKRERKDSYDKQFKEEAVRLSDEIGVKKAATQLGVPYYTLADWRSRRKQHGERAYVGSGHTYQSTGQSQHEIELERENAELRRANEILKDALGFFAKDRKK
jgi:transposase